MKIKTLLFMTLITPAMVLANDNNSDAINDLYAITSNIEDKVNHLRKDMYSGVASGMAMSSLPDAPNGKSGLVAGSSMYGSSGAAIAAGYAFSSEEGNFKFKIQSSFDNSNEYGISMGIGYFW